MILKTLKRENGKPDTWTYIDNIAYASVYFNKESKSNYVSYCLKGAIGEILVEVSDHAYLMNDNGKTIESVQGKKYFEEMETKSSEFPSEI